MIDAVYFLLNKTSIRFGNKIYRQVVGITMGTNCAPLIADLFLYCYESQFMTKLHKDPSRTDLIDKLKNTYRYLDDIFSVIIRISTNTLARFIHLSEGINFE